MKQIPDIPFHERSTWQDWERFRRDVTQAIRESQASPGAGARLLSDVTLTDGVSTNVAHGLNQRARVFVSPWGGSATIEEIDSANPTTFVVLRATGADVTVDLLVVPAS